MPAMSASASAMRCSGTRASRAALVAGMSYSACVSGVRTRPGETQLTRMPSAAHSCASWRTSMISAALLAL